MSTARSLTIAHLAASPFFGGPERQMLGLARHLPVGYRSVFLSFAERGLARPFLDEVHRHGFEGVELVHNVPHLRQAAQEVATQLRRLGADILCCHGYKPDVIGWPAARRVGIPVMAVSHGWTGATLKVRVYESLDRWVLRHMDAVVGVSAAQADKVRRAGVCAERVITIRNAVDAAAFEPPALSYRERLHELFPHAPRRIVGAIGRLSPEKGFGQLVVAAARVCGQHADVGFVLFGDGPLRPALHDKIGRLGIGDRFVLAGFHDDAARYLPYCDLAAVPSFTEGLPMVVLEAFAAGVPVVATTVGGIPEVVDKGVNGYLVPPGDPVALADRITRLLRDDRPRRAMGQRGREKVRRDFTFASQSDQYQRLWSSLRPRTRPRPRPVPLPDAWQSWL